MNEAKEFTLAVKRVAGIKVAGCECYTCDICLKPYIGKHQAVKLCAEHGGLPDTKPCPTCAPWRELEKIWWHEDGYSRGMCADGDKWPCMCGVVGVDSSALLMHIKQSNPTYTIQSIRAMLESLGHRVGFIKWNHRQCDVHFSYKCGELWVSESDIAWDIMVEASADILQSDPLMLKAAIEYLKGVE